jgi:hypothetical protein
MARSAGPPGPIPGSRFEAPDGYLINSRFWDNVTMAWYKSATDVSGRDL